MRRTAAGAAGGIAVVLGVGWAGLQVSPAPFPRYPRATLPTERVELPHDLSAPVLRYLKATVGERVPVVRSAVLSGRGHLRLSGITFPARLRFTHAAASAYRHYIEATWFGLPLLRVNEWYLDGHARLQLPFGTVSDEPKVDQGASLALWGEEAFWLPSALATDPRVRWEAIDATRARLFVPSGSADDAFTATFDAQTGLLRRLQALRYRSAADVEKIPWFIEPLAWQTFDEMRLLSRIAVTWQDEGTPWLVMTVEDAAYNVDVSAYIRSSGA